MREISNSWRSGLQTGTAQLMQSQCQLLHFHNRTHNQKWVSLNAKLYLPVGQTALFFPLSTHIHPYVQCMASHVCLVCRTFGNANHKTDAKVLPPPEKSTLSGDVLDLDNSKSQFSP